MEPWLIILDAIRLTAAVAGGIVLLDAARDLTGRREMHAATRKESAVKWALGSLSLLVLGPGLFLSTRIEALAQPGWGYQVILGIGWALLALMFGMRARTRATSLLAVDLALGLTFIASMFAGWLDRGL